MEYKLLSKIKGPEDIKKLREDQLPDLANEIRDKMIHTVSKNGGHLSSNLGVVELTIALHRVFRSPYDKIVWDVGHQCYAHKMLTGRAEEFDTLRQPGGISGFTRRGESEHDIFSGGHSSVALSAAFGIAEANKRAGSKAYTVAVVGDGAFTGGMVYEALNNAGHAGKGTRLIVILNDNEMSISKNVGALARYFAMLKANPQYFRLKATTENVLNHIPVVGRPMAQGIYNVKTRVKNAIYKSTMFEDMGFRYMGPIDGHDIPHLIDALEGAVEADYPILLHINTVKGKGYSVAEKEPEIFHGISAFNIETGEKKLGEKGFSEAFGEYISAAAAENEKICCITAAMTLGTGLSSFAKRFPDRFYDVGIAEQHAVTFAAGLARGGMLPVFAVYSTFLQRSYDQIIHDCAMQGLKIVFAVDRAGFVGDDGESHHGLFDAAFLNSIPDITVYAPTTFAELKTAFDKALYKAEGPVAVRYPRGGEPRLPAEYLPSDADFDYFGDPEPDVALVTYGRLWSEAIRAKALLEEQGLRTGLLKLNRIKPVPKAAVRSVMGAKGVYFFEEGQRFGGIGETFADKLCKYGFRGEYVSTGVKCEFCTQNTVEGLLHEYKLDAASMAALATERQKER
ncbi:MAG: 1-deoxy-D-xylulose-5-phosphate synthase [Clostridia bacterium]|nr:1-deoxy-D-xylulose-5-phosphate synthase [Clostridia bacterium]